MRKQLALLGLALILLSLPSWAVAEECAGGSVPHADLGISRLKFQGAVEIGEDGVPRKWRFDAEPEILAISADSPAAGRLRKGDRIVAIDGRLITTSFGGERMSGLRPGEWIRLEVRRGGEVRSVQLLVGSKCPEKAAERSPQTAWWTFQSDDRLPRLLPRGWLGVALACDCSIESDAGSPRWSFAAPPAIGALTPGGPAERGGLRPGDTLLKIDGLVLTTAAGGAAFSTMEPGQVVRLTVVRDGSEEEVEVVVAVRPRP